MAIVVVCKISYQQFISGGIRTYWTNTNSDLLKVTKSRTAKCSDCSARATEMATNPCHVPTGALAYMRACMIYAFRDIGYDGCSRHWRL